MRLEMVKVTSGGELLTTVPVEIFDSIDEALTHFTAEAPVLDLINSMHRINVTNKARVTELAKGDVGMTVKEMTKLARKMRNMSPAEQLAAFQAIQAAKQANAAAEVDGE